MASDEAGAGTRPRDTVEVLAERPTSEYDEVRLQADYAVRAMLSFYRFRQLGGGRLRGEGGAPNEARKLNLDAMEPNGVHYVSDHPEVRMLQLSVIALLVLFESAANAYFFAQQSAFGISGGLFQAAAVSIANVATSYFIIGYWGLRHASTPANWRWNPRLWDARNYYKIFGITAIGVGVIIALLVNLSAAHYRNLIDIQAIIQSSEDVEATRQALQGTTRTLFNFGLSGDTCERILTSPLGEDIGAAATNAMCRPFALHSLDAMVLFALGLAISALAAFEGRGADAAYPGLSDAARAFEKAKQDLQYALEEYYDSIEDLVVEARLIVSGRPIDDDEGETVLPEADQKDLGYHGLSFAQEMELRDRLRARVERYQAILTSDPDVLSDEFGVARDIVDAIARKRGAS